MKRLTLFSPIWCVLALAGSLPGFLAAQGREAARGGGSSLASPAADGFGHPGAISMSSGGEEWSGGGFGDRSTSHSLPNPLLLDMARIDRVYIPALALTQQGRQEASERAIAHLRTRWRALYGTLRDADPGDPRWKRDLADVDQLIALAAERIGSRNLADAHEKLESVRLTFLEMRRRHGLPYYLDVLTDYHGVMEPIVVLIRDKEPSQLSAGDLIVLRESLYPVTARKFRDVESAAPDPKVFRLGPGDLERTRALVREERRALDRLGETLRRNNKADILQAAQSVQIDFSKLYMSFGEFQEP